MEIRWFILALAALSLLSCERANGQGAGGPRPAAEQRVERLEPPPFLVFDAIEMRGKPNLTRHGLHRLHMIYASALWPTGAPRDEPNLELAARRAREAAATGQLACVDIEHWPVGPNAPGEQVQRSIAKYVQVADAMHAAAPGLRLGFYSVPPVREYWPAIQGGEELERWRAANARLAPLAERVDVIFPSLYTFYDDPQAWRQFAIASLREARQYDRPVYAFLMPVYHDSNERIGNEPVDAEFWRLQLDTCREHADGVVIWRVSRKHPWDPQAPWWRETLAFIERVK